MVSKNKKAMMEQYELRTGNQPSVSQRGYHGRFKKGHVPFCKGRNWSEWMPKEHWEKVKAIGLKNLNHKKEPRGYATFTKPVIAIDADGRMTRHNSIKDAALHFHCSQFNLGRCCRFNHRGAEPTGTWKKVNTDHTYMGIRFYFEDDVQLWSNARRRSL